MNTYDFFMAYFGKFLLQEEGKSYRLAARVLNESYPGFNKDGVIQKQEQRITAGWALIQPNGSKLQKKLTAKGITYCPDVTRFEAFGEVLDNWQDIHTMFITFGKASLSIENLFITVDLRAVRICAPTGVQTFDYTKDPTQQSPTFHKVLFKRRKKNAA